MKILAARGQTWAIAGALAMAGALAVDAWRTASPSVAPAPEAPSASAPNAPLALTKATPAVVSAAEAQACTGFAAPAQAIASPAAWVTSEDYPADAIRRDAQGTSGIAFRVMPDGRIGNCTVDASSGDAVLDEAACRLVTERARYAPMRDAAGCPVTSGIRTLRFTWRLPDE